MSFTRKLAALISLPYVLLYLTDLCAQQPLARSHMDHVRAMEGKSDKARGEYIMSTLKALGLEYVVHEYKQSLFGKGFNIVFETGSGPKTVVFLAHYDSKPGSPGANDNASSVAVVLSLYPKLVAEPPKNIKVRFIVTGDEENHVLGSNRYVKDHRDMLKDVIGAISLEMSGIGDTLYAWDLEDDRDKQSVIMGAVRAIAREIKVEIRERGKVAIGGTENYSDHRSFRDIGIPGLPLTLLPGSNPLAPFQHYHKSTDTAETLDPKSMELMTEIVLRVIRGLDVSP